MHWGSYEIFSVLSGLVWMACGLFIPNEPVKDRIWSILGGAFFIGYGIYVANQTSGTFGFPIEIFVLPFLGVFYLIGSLLSRRLKTDSPSDKGQ